MYYARMHLVHSTMYEVQVLSSVVPGRTMVVLGHTSYSYLVRNTNWLPTSYSYTCVQSTYVLCTSYIVRRTSTLYIVLCTYVHRYMYQHATVHMVAETGMKFYV